MKFNKQQDNFQKQLIEEWAPLLAGVRDQRMKYVIAQVAQNQMQYIENLSEATTTANTGPFTKFVFPMLLKLFPNLIANQLFSVQPIDGPVGAVVYYDWQYGDTKGNASEGGNLISDFNKFYSSEFIDYEVKNTGPIADTATLTSADLGSTPFQWLPVYPADTGKGYVLTITFIDAVDDSSKTIVDDGAGNLVHAGINVGTVNYSTGAWSVNLAGVPGAPEFKQNEAVYATYYYNQERVSTALGTGTQKSKIPELNFDLQVQEIKAKRRSMKIRTTADAMDDIRALHGVDGMAMLVAGMANQMALGLDREMIGDVIDGARYSATFQHGPTFGGADILRPLDSIRELLTVINAVSAAIQKGSNRGPGNFLVMSPEVSSLLEQLTTHGDYMMVNRIEDPEVGMSFGGLNSQYPINNVGTLLKRYRVFEDPYIETDTILVGYRGPTYPDAGYVFAPYIPMEMTNAFLDPDDFTLRQGARSRYATRLLRPEYYGVINVSGLPTVTVI